MKLIYVNESNFKKDEIDFSDEHYSIAKKLHEKFNPKKCTPLMVCNDKKSLCFTVNVSDKKEDRVVNECGKHLYKIKIEKF